MSSANKQNRVGPKGYGVNVETITAALTLVFGSAKYQIINGGASDRDVTLPALAKSKALWFYILNAGATNNLVVKNPAGTALATLQPNRACMVACNGTVWSVLTQSQDNFELAIPLKPFATVTEYDLWIAPFPCQVTKIAVVPSTLQGGALTATLVKASGTDTPVKTTTPLHAADAIDLNTGAYTVQNITLSATVADLKFAVGNRLSIDFSGAYNAGHAAIAVSLKKLAS